MRRFTLFLCISLSCLLATLLALTAVFLAGSAHAGPRERAPVPRSTHATAPVVSSSTGAFAKAVTDSFYVYGGPGALEGSFEGPYEGIPDDQGWFGVDRTLVLPKWQVSQYNAATLGDHGPGNHALWCGVTAEQEPGWVSAPGYGNGWDQPIVFTSPPLSDPTAGQTVDLDFLFHHDTEPGYDFFEVDYDSAGTWTQVYRVDGSDKGAGGVFPAPGVRFSQTQFRPIAFIGGDYGGESGDRVRIRLRFRSDGARSDQHGLWPTSGAVQLDDLSLDWSDGSRFWDMESGWPVGWSAPVDFVGDFAGVFPSLPELDLCSSNEGPLVAFVDEGQDACPDTALVYDPDAECSTGGTRSVTVWGGNAHPWVVNYNGGLSTEGQRLRNEFWSPPLDWDLPGPSDDGTDVVGAELRFDVYANLPVDNAIFYTWSIRSHDPGGEWSPWRNANFVYFGGTTPLQWQRREVDVTPYLELPPEQVQLALGVWDLADIFPFPGGDATTSPHFDNVALVKWRLTGPRLSAQEEFLAHDGFPLNGSIDASSSIARDELDVPFDMAADEIPEQYPPQIDPGDSIVVRAEAVIPGTSLVDLRLVWVLDKNPLFEDGLRAPPSGPLDTNVDASGPTQWTGETLADSVGSAVEALLDQQYFFDLPDRDFLYPGDVLRYYVRATDDVGNVSTLPADIGGFLDGVDYPRRFTVRALPSLLDPTGVQPATLVINGFGHRDGESDFLLAMAQTGRREGVEFDTYTVRAPFESLSNGIGSPGGHGATAEQLGGYEYMVFLNGDLEGPGLSDGRSSSWNDEADDIAVLTAWHDLPGNRSMAHFGDSFASNLSASPAAETYSIQILGLQSVASNVGFAIDGQRTPEIQAQLEPFFRSFIIHGGCPRLRSFDHLALAPEAIAGHAFIDPVGSPYPDPPASVIHDRQVDGDRKLDITFPFGVSSVRSSLSKSPGSRTELALLFQQVFDFFGDTTSGDPTDTPRAAVLEASLRAHPTPFNPRTHVTLRAPATDHVTVEIFDLRGRKVRVLYRGPMREGGVREMSWDGRDDRGAVVSSGVYLVRARATEFRVGTRVVLLK